MVYDDTLDGYKETTVQTDGAIRLDGLCKTIAQTLELPFGWSFANISS